MIYSQLKKAFKKHRFTAAIIGLGYVGMPTAIAIAKSGAKIIGLDINKERVKQINAGKSFIAEISNETLLAARKKFYATSDWKELTKANVVIIAVPTPLNKNKAPEMGPIEFASKNIAKHLKKGQLIILESTSYPTTTEEFVKPILEKTGLVAGKDFYLAFAPERIDPGNKKYAFTEVPKVVGGIDNKSTELAAAFYESYMKQVHKVSSPRVAEMTKLLENIFRLVNISMINELGMLAGKLNIDIWEVIEAAKTKPYGFMPFYPGPGVGGHCIPLDPFYLSWKAREINFFTRFIDLAGEINELMPHQVVTKIIWALNNHKKPVAGSKILVLGVAYKKDIDDPRESAAIEIIWDLARKNATVSYSDPYVPELTVKDKTFYSAPLTPELIKKSDCVVIITDHSAYDYRMILKNAKLIVDTRNAIKEKSPRVLK